LIFWAEAQNRNNRMAMPSELTVQEIALIKARIKRGDKYEEIAADYRLNQGRIADLKFGRRFPEIAPATLPV